MELGLEDSDIAAGEASTLAIPESESRIPDRIGPYRLLEKLGEGGMGVVYLAEQQEPIQRRVALKIIRLGMDSDEVIARFESERQALAMMNHPGIAGVLDAGTTERGAPYFVMEHVPGIPITDFCDRHRLGFGQRLELFAAVCRAVHHAHQKGIIHRDIKPSNVLVVVADGEPRPKVIDFGVAKATHQRLTEQTLFTQQGRMVGTPEYMSPEQAEMSRLDVDITTDIYSLGVLLYELLTGALPFERERLRRAGYAEIQRIIREEEPEKPSTRVSGAGANAEEVANRRHTAAEALARRLRGDLDWITMKALEKDRVRRYQSATELAADVGRHLAKEPVIAGPPGAAYRARKFITRHRGPVTAAAAFLALIALALASTLVLYLRTNEARKAADDQRVRADGESKRAEKSAYQALLSAAQISLRTGAVGEAQRQLAQCVPGLRGWEWHHLSLAADSSLKTYKIGDRLKSNRQATLLVRQRPTWEELLAKLGLNRLLGRLGTQTAWSTIVAISTDGSRAASYSLRGGWPRVRFDGSRQVAEYLRAVGEHRDLLRVREVETGDLVAVLQVPDAGTRSFPEARSGNDFHVGRSAAGFWVLESGHRVATLGRAPELISAVFGQDGTRLAAWSWEPVIYLWELDGTKLVRSFAGHSDGISDAVFFDHDRRLASASWDRTVRVWEISTGRATALFKGSGGVTAVTASPDDRWLAWGAVDGSVGYAELAEPKEARSLPGHASAVTAIAFDVRSERIASGSDDGIIKLWHSESGRQLGTLAGHEGAVTGLVFTPEGKLLSGSDSRKIKEWNSSWAPVADVGRISDGLSLAVFDSGPMAVAPRNALRVSPQRGRLYLRRAHSDEVVRAIDLSPDGRTKTAEAHEVAVSGDGRYAAVAAHEGTGVMDKEAARLWLLDVESGEVLRRWGGAGGYFTSPRFSGDGGRLLVSGLEIEQAASGSEESGTDQLTFRTSILDVRTGEELLGIGDTDRANAAPHVAWSPAGDRIVGAGRKISLWDAESGALLSRRYLPSVATAVAFDPEGTWLAVGSRNGDVSRWEPDPPRWVSRKGHEESVDSVAFSPDGARLASASRGGVVLIWDTASWEVVLRLHGDSVRQAGGRSDPFLTRGLFGTARPGPMAIAFSPDGAHLAASTPDGHTRVWAARPQTPID